MKFKLFKRERTDHISLEEVEMTLTREMEKIEEDLDVFIHEKASEIKKILNNLLSLLERFDCSNIHPRLRNPSKNFVLAMINLWKDARTFDDSELISEAGKRLQKVTLMKSKHYRMIFAIQLPEIKEIDECFKEMAAVIENVNRRYRETKILEIKSSLEKVNELKKFQRELTNLQEYYSSLIDEERRMGQDSIQEKAENERLKKLEEEIKTLTQKIEAKERDINRKLAYARKPIKMYAHMIGVRVKDDLLEEPELELLASKAATEISRGRIKLKEKKIDAIIDSLNGIADGSLRLEVREVREMKKRLLNLKNQIRKVQAELRSEKTQVQKIMNLKKKIEATQERIRLFESKILAIKINLEKELGALWKKDIKIEL
jgi:hypothetical protein